jgi:hypothetical protein
MPPQPPSSPLGTFLAALREAQIKCSLIGAMAAVRQGAPITTIDYDFWVRLPERGRDKDLAVLPILERTLRLSRRLKSPGRTQR